jgi:alpha-glucan,water dikinase
MVWASKFNERAFLATKKIGFNLHAIYMAVLVQRIIPSEYAYVVHTTNPTNGEDAEVYVESCLGLGEALVSQMPGQAFSFTFNKVNEEVKINAYPNKPLALSAEGFIFRSDSNSEDLPGFAGAGLFDSYPMTETTERRVAYSNEKLLQDKSFRLNFMQNIGKIGVIIEDLY